MNVNLKNRIREQDCLGVYAQHDGRFRPNGKSLVAFATTICQTATSAPHAASESAIPSAAQPNVAFGLRHGLSQPNAKERYYNFDMSGIWIVEGTPTFVPKKATTLRSRPNTPNRVTTSTASVYYNHVQDKIATAAPYYKKPGDKLPYLPYVNLGLQGVRW